MRVSIITPSFRNSNWLKLCIASVADQVGDVEHIIQDAGSDDGTLDWLVHDPRVKTHVEKDKGMYDAVNRGFRRANGEILAYLNCDEQYLPGALQTVRNYFTQHPHVDVLFSDTIVVDTRGEYLCHRYSLSPLRSHLWFRLPMLTCALFLRRRVLDELDLYFDPNWRDLGDKYWLMQLVKTNARVAVLRRFTSVFTETGDNMSLKPNAQRERQVMADLVPRWVKPLSPILLFHYRMRMLASGTFFQRPFDYALYTLASPDHRVMRHAAKPTGRWPGRN